MNAIIKLAIAKCIKDASAASSEVAAGVYAIDTTVRVRGTVTKGADYAQAVSQSIPWQRIAYALFAVLARHIGPKAVMEALKGFEDGAEIDEVRASLNAAATMFAGAMTEASTKMVAGKVTTKLTVTEVATEAGAAAEVAAA